MGLICLAAAKGSPGVTTTALALGALWPRPVLVAECDSAGADVPLRMASDDGGVVDPDRGLLSLAAAGRKGLHSDLVLAHSQRVLGGLEVLVGPRVPEQAAGLTNMWPMLGPALDGIRGHDVIADCGRIGVTTPQNVLLRSARLLILVCGTEPSAVVHLRERLLTLAPTLDPGSAIGTPIAVAVVATPKARDAVSEVRESLERTEVPLQAVWHLADDAKGAKFFRGQGVGRADKTYLVRTARTISDEAARIVEPFFEPLPEFADPPVDSAQTAWGDFSFAPTPAGQGDNSSAGNGAMPSPPAAQPPTAPYRPEPPFGAAQ